MTFDVVYIEAFFQLLAYGTCSILLIVSFYIVTEKSNICKMTFHMHGAIVAVVLHHTIRVVSLLLYRSLRFISGSSRWRKYIVLVSINQCVLKETLYFEYIFIKVINTSNY